VLNKSFQITVFCFSVEKVKSLVIPSNRHVNVARDKVIVLKSLSFTACCKPSLMNSTLEKGLLSSANK